MRISTGQLINNCSLKDLIMLIEEEEAPDDCVCCRKAAVSGN